MQHDYNIANSDGATVRADINSALQSLAECSSGATAPSTTFAYQWWADTANDLLKQRNAANSGWISILTLSTGAVTSGGTDTTYSAGSGLDLSTTVFSVETDLRDGITHVGLDAGDYIGWTNNTHTSFFVNGGEEMRLEADGDLHADGDVIAYSTTISDERLKENITTVDNALNKVKAIRGVEFTRKDNGEKSAGVIAQEIEKVLPQAVKEKELPLKMNDGVKYKVVEYDALHAILIESIKELSARIEVLEGK